jgi:SPP1 gp7 family putative phage head morphogenesis protein
LNSHPIHGVDNEESPDMQREAARIARGIYNGTIIAGSIDERLTELVAAELRKAVIEGFGKDFTDLDTGTPHYKMLESLEKNVFHFSAAKNYQQLKSMTLALRDDQGEVRSFRDFKNEAAKISQEYNGRWLKTEYDSAVGSGQMAGKWTDFEINKETAPWLRYDTAGDRRVRPGHKAINGVTKQVDDAFWNIWYPPNGWGCRCDVTQLINGADSQGYEAPDDVPVIFRNNLAKNGMVFPPQHPYFIGTPEDILKQGEGLIPVKKL